MRTIDTANGFSDRDLDRTSVENSGIVADERVVWAACLDGCWDDGRDFDGWHFGDETWQDDWNVSEIDVALEKCCIAAVEEGAWGYAGERFLVEPKWIGRDDVQNDPEYREIEETCRFLKNENDTVDRIGYIYLISNMINGKQYVGQTGTTVLERWNGHIDNAFSNDKSNMLIDEAISSYGIQCFTVEIIETCDECELDGKEIYWIKKYDCCAQDGKDKGYNWRRGGQHAFLTMTKQEELCEFYSQGGSLSEIIQRFDVGSSRTIQNILRKHNIPIRNKEDQIELQRQAVGYEIIAYDDDMNEVMCFNSVSEAADWASTVGGSPEYQSNTATIISSYLCGHKAWGFYWEVQGYSEEKYEFYRFKRLARGDKTNKFLGIAEKIEPSLDDVVFCSETHSKEEIAGYNHKYMERVYGSSDNTRSKKCAYVNCQELISDDATYCRFHFLQRSRKTKRPTNDELIRIVALYGYESAGRLFNVSGNAVKKWLKQVDLPYLVQDIYNYALDNNIISLPYEAEHINRIKALILEGISQKQINSKVPCTKMFYCWYYKKLKKEFQQQGKNLPTVEQKENMTQSIEQWSIDNKTRINVYSSVKEAAKTISPHYPETRLNTIRDHICKCCRGTAKTAYGYIWKRVDQK